MNIYHYNQFGVYTHTTKARPNPKRMENGQLQLKNDGHDYLIPSCATIDEPPSVKKGEVAVYRKGWKKIEDVSGDYFVINNDGQIVNKAILISGMEKPENYIKVEIPESLDIPKWDGSKWIEGKTKEEKWQEIRLLRTGLLYQTDYTQVPDCSFDEDIKAKYREYRVYLRDIPNSNSDPFKIKIKTFEEFYEISN